MRDFVSNIIFRIIVFIDTLFSLIFKKSIRRDVYDLLREKNYTKISIEKSSITFFTPSHLSHWRAKTIFSKEKETINWIDNFSIEKDDIFWDIGANVGTYSLYATIKHPLVSVIAFEPSFLNLNLLSRNININQLQEKISIVQLPLSNEAKHFQFFNETSLIEGAAINSFDSNVENLNRKILSKTRVIGTNIDTLVKNRILKCPKYIKIDVDNLERLILEGMGKSVLNEKYLNSILIELDEFNKEDYNMCINILRKNGFYLREKSRSYEPQNEKLKGTYNYIFDRRNEITK